MKRTAALIICLAVIVSLGVPALAARDLLPAEAMAADLKELGLFLGYTETEFGLADKPDRVQAVVMLIRVLGKETEAKNGNWKEHPFTDVPDWADDYIGYAYQNGLTMGSTETLFGTMEASSEMFLTFMLRALGYQDGEGKDFMWNDPYDCAREAGILPYYVDTKNFLRADVVYICYAALVAETKPDGEILCDRLINAGAFTAEAFESCYDPNAFGTAQKPDETKELTAEEIYERCAPAVFYIVVYDINGTPMRTGSGFFIDESGIAVTNYHVVQGAASAKVTLSYSGEEVDVLGVYEYDADSDWAVIKVDGSGYPILEMNYEEVRGGATVYAIGSPLGLQSTISQGIVSNPARPVYGVTYIQTSAAISHGSSGGALIDKYGRVIGITSAMFEDGQNLNLALPVGNVLRAQTEKYESLEDCFIHDSVGITSSVYSLQLKKGETKTIKVTYTGGSLDSVLKFVHENNGVIACEWGEWETRSTCSLDVKGESAGNVTLRLWIDDTAHADVAVTVTE